jgi:hypothetical protein
MVRVHAPLQGGSVALRKPKEDTRKRYAARALNKDMKNVNTGVAFEAKALGGSYGATVKRVTTLRLRSPSWKSRLRLRSSPKQ